MTRNNLDPLQKPRLVNVLELALVSVALASCGGEAAAPPDADLNGADPSVAAHIRARTEAVRREPESETAWARLAAAFEVNGFVPEAVRSYERLQEMAPRDFRWPYFLGICRRTDDQQAAVAHFLRAVGLQADHVPLLVCLGVALVQVDRSSEARTYFQTACNLDPRCAPAWSGLGGVALSQGDTKIAIEYLVKAVTLFPAYRDAHRMLAQAYRRQGDDKAADREQRIERDCIRVDKDGKTLPDVVPLPDPDRDRLGWEEGYNLEWLAKRAARHREAGQVAAAAKVWEEGLDHYRRAASRPTATNRTRFLYGVALANAGFAKAAIPVLQAALKVEPNHTKARMNLAACLALTGNLEAALQTLRVVIRDQPDNASARYNLGMVLSEAGRFREAADAFNELAKLQPRDPQVYEHWGTALTRIGRQREAIDVYRKGLVAAPNHRTIANQLAWLLAAGSEAAHRNGREAVSIARGLCEATQFRVPTFLDTLAAASAEVGDFDTAVKMATRAYQLATAEAPESGGPGGAPPNPYLKRIEVRLNRYFRAGRAYHGPQ